MIASSFRMLRAGPVSSATGLKVLVAGGHPGDPEYGCGGTIARYAQLGSRVTLLYLNRGEKGCPQQSSQVCANTRVAEAQHACAILGAKARFASSIDGESVVNATSYAEFHDILAAEKPDVLFTQWPIDNHRDHRALSVLTYDAWRRLGKSFGLYYYEVSDGEDTAMFTPTDFVDITTVEGEKRAACFAHQSQSPERFYGLQKQVMQFRGLESGHAYAEAFARHPESPQILLP